MLLSPVQSLLTQILSRSTRSDVTSWVTHKHFFLVWVCVQLYNCTCKNGPSAIVGETFQIPKFNDKLMHCYCQVTACTLHHFCLVHTWQVQTSSKLGGLLATALRLASSITILHESAVCTIVHSADAWEMDSQIQIADGSLFLEVRDSNSVPTIDCWDGHNGIPKQCTLKDDFPWKIG